MDNESIAVSAGALYVLNKLVSKPLDELGEILADKVRFWRFKNQISILEKAGKFAKKQKIEIKPIPLKTLFPLLEGASLEDTPSLQELWARLIVNSGDFSSPHHEKSLAIDLLKAISNQDAQVLNAFVRLTKTKFQKKLERHKEFQKKFRQLMSPYVVRSIPEPTFNEFVTMDAKEIIDLANINREQFELSFENISRFRILRSSTSYDMDGRPQGDDYFSFTRLGWRVIKLIGVQDEIGDLVEQSGI